MKSPTASTTEITVTIPDNNFSPLPEIRAQRRYDELKAKREEASFDEILENVKQRDYIDQNRDVSPLRKASDALLLDNSHLSISQQKEWLAEQFERVIKEKN